MKENNEVVSVLKDTKKLNAGIATLALQNIHEQGCLSEDQLLTATSLSERLTKTVLYKGDGGGARSSWNPASFSID